jgi:hypothetical protein
MYIASLFVPIKDLLCGGPVFAEQVKLAVYKPVRQQKN